MPGFPALGGTPSPGGINPLLGGLAALAQAVPAFFQGKELGMQNKLEQERLQTEQQSLESGKLDLLQKRLQALGPAAALGVPGATEAFRQTLSELQGVSGSPGSVTGAGNQAAPTQPGSMPSLGQVSPEAAGSASGASAQSGPGGSSISSGSAGAPPPGQAAQPSGDQPSSDQAMLEAYGFLTPAQQFARANAKVLAGMQPAQRIAYMRGQGVPMSEADEKGVQQIPFIPDPTQQNEALKTVDGLVQQVQGGKLNPQAYMDLIRLHAPALAQAGVTPDLIASLTAKHMTQLSRNAMLENEKLLTGIGYDKAQINAINKKLPGEIAKNAADTFAAYARGNESNVNASLAPQKLAIEAGHLQVATANLGVALKNLHLRNVELALNLQKGTTPGSPTNILDGMDKQIALQQKQLATLNSSYRNFFLSPAGLKQLVTGKVTLPDGTQMSSVDVQKQITGMNQTISAEIGQAAGLRSMIPNLIDSQLHAAGAPGIVRTIGGEGRGGMDPDKFTQAVTVTVENVLTNQWSKPFALKKISTLGRLNPQQKAAAMKAIQGLSL